MCVYMGVRFMVVICVWYVCVCVCVCVVCACMWRSVGRTIVLTFSLSSSSVYPAGLPVLLAHAASEAGYVLRKGRCM